MRLKNKFKFVLLGIAIPVIAIPTIYMTSCSTEDIKNFFQRILNAIKAIQSLGQGQTVVDTSNNYIHGVIKFEDLRKILFESFGITEQVFKNDVKNFDIVPNFKDGKNVLTITITLKDHASWPKEAIYSDLNFENPYHSSKAYYWIKDKSLIFDVQNLLEIKEVQIKKDKLLTLQKLNFMI